VANAFGQGPGALPGDFHETGISRNLIEHGQDSLRLRQEATVEIGLKLQ
jgi:hypothetical protein